MAISKKRLMATSVTVYRDRASQGALALHEGGRYERLEKVLYTANAHTTGGRAGMSRNSDGRLEVSKRTRAYG
jgi:hypothetical protein